MFEKRARDRPRAALGTHWDTWSGSMDKVRPVPRSFASSLEVETQPDFSTGMSQNPWNPTAFTSKWLVDAGSSGFLWPHIWYLHAFTDID